MIYMPIKTRAAFFISISAFVFPASYSRPHELEVGNGRLENVFGEVKVVEETELSPNFVAVKLSDEYTYDELSAAIKKIIVELLGVEEEKITGTSRYADDLEADPLDQVELLMAVEDKFTIKIPDELAIKLALGSVQDPINSLWSGTFKKSNSAMQNIEEEPIPKMQEGLTYHQVDMRVRKIIAEQLGVEEKKITNTSRYEEDLGADSLDTTELIMAFEDEFSIEISDSVSEALINGTVEESINYI